MKLSRLLNESKKAFDIFCSDSSIDVDSILDGFNRSEAGCNINHRGNCGVVAGSLAEFLERKGISAKRISGSFIVDNPDLGVKSFTKEEKKDMTEKGLDYRNLEDRKTYSEQIPGLIDELKKIPHYWTLVEGKYILDLSIRQFKEFMNDGYVITEKNYEIK